MAPVVDDVLAIDVVLASFAAVVAVDVVLASFAAVVAVDVVLAITVAPSHR